MVNMIPDCYRPSPRYPIYPPYHKGLYLEDYFYEWSKNKTFNRIYIPIFWTTLYCDNYNLNIQYILDKLDKSKKYFTVCQHDDAPKESLPPDTVVFSSGARNEIRNLVGLPSICSPVPDLVLNRSRDIFCSFVGAITHPIRNSMIDCLRNNRNYHLKYNSWTPSVPMENFQYFKEITERSVFSLCPRGYVKSSFILYECLQMQSIPVYISDSHLLPWQDELDWSKFCVVIKDQDIPRIDEILNSISEEKRNKMRDYGRTIYNEYFSLPGVCSKIEERVNR